MVNDSEEHRKFCPMCLPGKENCKNECGLSHRISDPETGDCAFERMGRGVWSRDRRREKGKLKVGGLVKAAALSVHESISPS